MKFGGFQKTSLLDFPGEVSSIVWTVGCNFRCPFCYNVDLVNGKVDEISENEILDYLKLRKGLVDGLVVTGGEPLMHDDLSVFLVKVKKLGYLIKIDTNGGYPDRLSSLIDEGIVDYVAMDVKAPKKKYDELSGVKTPISKVCKTIKIIQEKASDYEFRTTVIPGLLDKDDIVDIAKWLEGSKKYYLQQFKNDVPMISKKMEGLHSFSNDELVSIIEEVKTYFEICELRGL